MEIPSYLIHVSVIWNHIFEHGQWYLLVSGEYEGIGGGIVTTTGS